jgi:hypothetical protein
MKPPIINRTSSYEDIRALVTVKLLEDFECRRLGPKDFMNINKVVSNVFGWMESNIAWESPTDIQKREGN